MNIDLTNESLTEVFVEQPGYTGSVKYVLIKPIKYFCVVQLG